MNNNGWIRSNKTLMIAGITCLIIGIVALFWSVVFITLSTMDELPSTAIWGIGTGILSFVVGTAGLCFLICGLANKHWRMQHPELYYRRERDTAPRIDGNLGMLDEHGNIVLNADIPDNREGPRPIPTVTVR